MFEIQPDLITLKTFYNLQQAYLAKNSLENEDILCFLQNENSSGTMRWYTSTTGGIKLQIRPTDEQKAIEILEEAGYWNKNDEYIPQLPVLLNRITGKIPWIGKFAFLSRLILIFVFTIIITAAIYFIWMYSR